MAGVPPAPRHESKSPKRECDPDTTAGHVGVYQVTPSTNRSAFRGVLVAPRLWRSLHQGRSLCLRAESRAGRLDGRSLASRSELGSRRVVLVRAKGHCSSSLIIRPFYIGTAELCFARPRAPNAVRIRVARCADKSPRASESVRGYSRTGLSAGGSSVAARWPG